MLELVSENINKSRVLKVKSWNFVHGFIDNSLNFKTDSKDWSSFSQTKLLLLNQVHGKRILGINSKSIDADGWFVSLKELKEKKISIGIKTADCSPVIVYGVTKEMVSVLHCGWRSAYAGILLDCIKKFRELGESEIQIAIGPAAQVESYEVGSEFVAKFGKAVIKKVDKYYLSISSYLISQARAMQVDSIIASDICTIKNDQYFSYRRQKDLAGRQLSYVG